MRKLIWILLFLGLIIRLLLIPVPGFKIDTDAWFAWAVRLNDLNLNQFYSSQVWTNYTPGYLYVLKILGTFNNWLNLDSSTFYAILKLPAILADLILSFLIYKQFNKNHKQTISLLASIAILFNPAFIFNSSVWGQIDSILSLFIYLAIYTLDQKKYWLSGLLSGIAFLIKPQAIILGPIILVFLLRNFQIKNLSKIIISGLSVILILSLPFFLPSHGQNIFSLFINMVNDYPYDSMFAYNFWGGLVGFWISDKVSWMNISYQGWGMILFLVYLIIIGLISLKKKASIWAIAALISLAFYFLPTRVHERYLYPSLVLLIIWAIESKNKWLLGLTFTLSILHFLNLYYVYIYYNYFYLHILSSPYFSPIYQFLSDQARLLAQISTLIFVFISALVIKSNHARKTT